jgi:hypothetical protein
MHGMANSISAQLCFQASGKSLNSSITSFKYLKNLLLYNTFFLLTGLLFTSCGNQKKPLPPLKETYAKKDKNPFGSYVFYNQLRHVFYHNEINSRKENFETVWRQISDTASVYVLISKNLFLSAAGQKAMLDYVNDGNTLFISSENIDSSLLDSLGCKVNQQVYQDLANMKYTSVNLQSDFYTDTSAFQYFYFPASRHFLNYDTSITNVLGTNEHGKPDYLEVFYGRGKFYLHCEPRVLGNYFLLQKNNYQYLQQLFTFTGKKPEHVYWDDYYNKKDYPPAEQQSKSGIRLLLQYPATARAFWLVLLLLLLYILFGGKRRQRIVQPVAPNTNTTVAFTETVGHLYLQKKDNRNIADKMITYFMEHIRKQYYLNTSQVNDDFITTLSRKSNVPREAVEDVFQSIKLVHNSFEINDEQLLLLNHQIDNFYKNNN